MRTKRMRLAAVLASFAAVAATAGCGGGGSDEDAGANNNAVRTEAVKGGTINYLVRAVIEHWDPQRVYVGRDIANLDALALRGLVMFPPGDTNPETGATPIPDLATDTGTANSDATEWSFTIKDGPKWQDGQPVTCEDFKYGVSRTFATDVITGGPNYIIGYLDIPSGDDGLPAYKGPYTGEGQELFDKAVTCDGSTITYRFKKPWPDFPLAVAALAAFDPFREDQDKGEQSDLQIFSNGPYMLDDKGWSENKGGTFVRNPEWDPEEDTNREANPDQFTFEIGNEPEVIIDRLIADSGDDVYSIADQNVTPAQYPQITGSVADRAINTTSPYTYYLLPNFNRITNLKVRQALALATNRAAYVGALGGDKAAEPAQSVVNPSVPGFKPSEAFGSLEGGDIEAARKLLEESGEELPYPIKFTYPIGSEAQERGFAALKESYDQAGFDVTLDGLDPSGPYYEVVQQPDSDSDLIWGGWGSDWPSISTVIPPLFDSRINLTPNSNGQDYGNYKSDEVNAAIDQALRQPDLDAANAMWADINQMLADDLAYIPLNNGKWYWLRGSKVENYVNSVGTNTFPDLAVISVKAD